MLPASAGDRGDLPAGAVPAARTWYATTDADSTVSANWLLRMTATDADMVLGVVRVAAWRHHPAEVARRCDHADVPPLRGIIYTNSENSVIDVPVDVAPCEGEVLHA